MKKTAFHLHGNTHISTGRGAYFSAAKSCTHFDAEGRSFFLSFFDGQPISERLRFFELHTTPGFFGSGARGGHQFVEILIRIIPSRHKIHAFGRRGTTINFDTGCLAAPAPPQNSSPGQPHRGSIPEQPRNQKQRRTAQSSPEQPGATQSNPEQPRPAQSSPQQPKGSPDKPRTAPGPEQPRAAKSGPESGTEQPKAPQRSPAPPRAAKDSPAPPRRAQRSPEPRAAQNNPGQPKAPTSLARWRSFWKTFRTVSTNNAVDQGNNAVDQRN